MSKTVGDVYEEWDLSPVQVPGRSILYALEPIGVGTAFVESLTSYIARLADAHCVFAGVLIYKMIVPLMPGYTSEERQHPLFRADGYKSNLINGTGIRATVAVQSLEQLTGRSDLRALTLLIWTDVFPLRGLVRLVKAWCPACYEEWRREGKIIYDPLLWILQEVSICVRHRQHLKASCPYPDCRRSLPALTWRSRPGYCAYCHRWLGTQLEETKAIPEEEELIWQQWVMQVLGDMLIQMPTISFPLKREYVNEVIVSIVNRITNGKVTVFARSLGISKTMVAHWYHGGRIPEIAQLLRLCYFLHLSLCEVFCNRLETLRPQLRDDELALKLLPAKQRKKTEINRMHIYQVLEETAMSDENPPPSLAEVARRLGFGYSEIGHLYISHRDACATITARHLVYRQQQREARMQGYRKEIKRIAFELQSQHVLPTQKHIAPYLDRPGILRDPEVRKLLREVCQEVKDGE